MFFEFWSRSHFLDLQPNLLLLLEWGASLRSTQVCNLFFKIICRFGDIRVKGAKTKLGQLEKKLFLTFFSNSKFFGLLPQVSKHSMS